jgi:hypothetical protein
LVFVIEGGAHWVVRVVGLVGDVRDGELELQGLPALARVLRREAVALSKISADRTRL